MSVKNIFLITCLLFLCCEAYQQRIYYRVSRRRISDSSVKGEPITQQIEQRKQHQPKQQPKQLKLVLVPGYNWVKIKVTRVHRQRVLVPENNNIIVRPIRAQKQKYSALKIDCDEHKNATDEVADSFSRLTFLGDRQWTLSEEDEHMEEQCLYLSNHMKIFDKHLKCVQQSGEGGAKLFNLMQKGFRILMNERCKSREWHDKYIELSKCIGEDNVKENLHECSDRLSASYKYIAEKTPKQRQPKYVCCVYPLINECMHQEIRDVCGAQNTTFFLQFIWLPHVLYVNHLCKGKYTERCDSRTMNKLETIFDEEHPHEEINLYKYYFQILKNFAGNMKP